MSFTPGGQTVAPVPPIRYVPAPHIASDSFLTRSQLDELFQDFYSSLDRITVAPDFVFERLVANLKNVLGPTIQKESGGYGPGGQSEIERQLEEVKSAISAIKAEDRRSGTMPEGYKVLGRAPQSVSDRLKEDVENLKSALSAMQLESEEQGTVIENLRVKNQLLRLLNDRLKAELKDLKATSSGLKNELLASGEENRDLQLRNENICAELRDAKSTLSEQAETMTRELEEKEQLKNQLAKFLNNIVYPHIGKLFCEGGEQKEVTLSRDFAVAPYLPIGITFSNNLFHKSISAHADISATSSPTNAKTRTYQGSVRLSGSTTWMRFEWLEIYYNCPFFECGTQQIAGSGPKSESRIATSFRKTYNTPPQVVVWISAFNRESWRKDIFVWAYATGITTTGFELCIHGFNDPRELTTVWWVAFDSNNVSAYGGTAEIVENSTMDTYVSFGSSVFDAPPRVMIGMNKVDIGHENSLKFDIKPLDITAAGMTCRLDYWMKSTNSSPLGASFIAFG